VAKRIGKNSWPNGTIQDKRNNPITDSYQKVQKRIMLLVLTNDFEEPYFIKNQIPAKGGGKYED